MSKEKKLKEKMDKLRQVKDVVFSSDIHYVSLSDKINLIIKENPNDYDLGGSIRKFYLETLS